MRYPVEISGADLRIGFVAVLVVLLAWAPTRPASGQAAGTRHVLIIGGLGGNPTYTDQFASYLNETRTLLVDRFGIPAEQVHVLGEQAVTERAFVDDVSTAETIRSYVARLSEEATPDDHVYVILYGHGSFDGTHARFNMPRRDLDDAAWAAILDPLEAGRVVFINTTSSSGPFATALSHPDRVVITATATGTERDQTDFPRHFVEALRASAADLDKNGGLSVRELFVYAAEQTAGAFEEAGQLATEHALIDDDGDGTPTRFDEMDDAGDGALAALTYLRPPPSIASASETASPLLRQKEAIRRSIAEVKRGKATMDEDRYYAELESLFVQLARLNERIERGPEP